MRKRSSGIIIKNGKILLMYRRKDGVEYYAIPGGGVEKGEDSKEAVIREVKEETNLDCVIDFLLFEFDGQFGKEYFYVVRDINGKVKLGGPELDRQSAENFYELIWVELSKVKDVNILPIEIKNVIMEAFCRRSDLVGAYCDM